MSRGTRTKKTSGPARLRVDYHFLRPRQQQRQGEGTRQGKGTNKIFVRRLAEPCHGRLASNALVSK